ncbi:hypothetical protein RO07_20345 [Pandoraea pulmonicola]|nr:hypothetical protein RO07_20345 [Pandoraea pulmonicola]
MGATMALALLYCVWLPASARTANSPDAPGQSEPSVIKSHVAASAAHGARSSRGARVKRATRTSAFAPPGSPPPALVGAAPTPWHDVFGEAGAWAADPIVVSGRTLNDTLANAGVTHPASGLITGPRAGLTGLYQTVWHHALANSASKAPLFAGAPEYFGLHF